LHSEAARRLVANGLAVAANRANIFGFQFLLVEEGVNTPCRQFHPVLLGDGGAGNLVRAAGAQTKQLGAQGVRHWRVVRGDEFYRRGQLDQRYVQAVEAGPGHHTYIKRHGLALSRSQLRGFLLIHARHQRLALREETCAFSFGDRISHGNFLA